MNTGKIIRNLAKKTPVYQTYESKKVTVNYSDDKNKSSFSGTFAIKQDDKIKLSLKKISMPVGRCLVTSDSLFLVNYFEKYFIKEGVENLQSLFGIDIDYNMLQALLTADVSNLMQDKNFDKSLTSLIDENMYRIDSEFDSRIDKAISKGNDKKLNKYMQRMDESEFLKYSVWIDPEFFVIRKLSFLNLKQKEELVINFDQYELVGRSLFPQNISLDFYSPKQNMNLDMKLSRSTVDKTKEFNFSIPDKYEKFNIVKN